MNILRTITVLTAVMISALSNGQDPQFGRMVENGGAGSYLAMVTSNQAFPEYTVYSPARLQSAASKTNIPLIVFANGSCNNNPVPYDNFLNELASFGYYVVAVGPYIVDPTQASENIDLQSQASADVLVKAIDKVCEQVRNPQSNIYGLVDTTHICVMGHGCGGYQALIASADPRVTNTMCLNSGIGDLEDGQSAVSLFEINQKILSKIHSPIMFIVGGEDDPAYYKALSDYEMVDNAFTVAATYPSGADGTFSEEYGGAYATVVLQWLDWHMKDNQVSRGIFTGEECICAYSMWELKQRNLNKVFGE